MHRPAFPSSTSHLMSRTCCQRSCRTCLPTPQDPKVKLFHLYEKYARPCFKALYPDSLDPVLHALTEGHCHKVASAMAATRKEARLAAVYEGIPSDVRPYLPMLLSPLMLTALVAMSRLDRLTRLNNPSFCIVLLHKLRLPLFAPGDAPQCRRGKRPDIYGDHFFSCKKCHKMAAHHQIRNALHLILQELGLITGLCYTKVDVKLEAKRLLKRYPRKRPLNVAVSLRHNHTYKHTNRSNGNVAIAGADVTLIKFKPLLDCGDLSQLTAQAVRRHQVKEQAKLRGTGKKDSLLGVTIPPHSYMTEVNKAGLALTLLPSMPLTPLD